MHFTQKVEAARLLSFAVHYFCEALYVLHNQKHNALVSFADCVDAADDSANKCAEVLGVEW